MPNASTRRVDVVDRRRRRDRPGLAWRARAQGLSVTVLERGEIGRGNLACGRGDARAGGRGRVRRGRAGGARAGAALGGAVAGVRGRAGAMRAARRWACCRTGTLVARPRRGRGARARAPDRLPRIARAAHDPSARRARRASASRRSRRPSGWRWKRRRTTRSIHAWCSWRCAGHVRRPGWGCASTRRGARRAGSTPARE